MISGNTNRPPIIIIGMHRSGTSMVSRTLEDIGLFAGDKKEHNNEALFFFRLNEWLLRQSGGAWDHPEPVRRLLEHREARFLATDYLGHMMKTPWIAEYMGWKNYLDHRSPTDMGVPWGWKDPRNTYTLPFWLDLFPEARAVHVYRHGIDTASSLKVREERMLASSKVSHERRKLLYWLRPKRGGFLGSPRCTSLEGGFSLWEEYLTEASSHVKRLGERAMEVKYEEFLAEPRSVLGSLAEFCGLPATRKAVADASNKVRKERAYAYKADPDLRAFADQVGERLAAQGY